MSLTDYILLLTCYVACRPQAVCGNAANENSSQVIDSIKCGLLNISCGFEKICRGGVCIEIKTNSTDGGKGEPRSTEMTYKVVSDPTYEVTTTRTRPPRRTHSTTTSHSFISGNQEFAIALVGFSVLFINFCLISFCLGRMKRRRLEQQRQERQHRRQEATHSSQASQTGDWNAEYLNMGIDNFALNGDLDAYSNDFMFPRVRLPPYDFSSAYHKPTPMTEEETGEGESFSDVSVDVQDINEDPPPYSDQQFDHLGSPPSYNETLTVSTTTGESS